MKYYWECLKMWWKWVRPEKSFIAMISFVAVIIGLLAWLVTKSMHWPDVSQIASLVIFGLGLVVSIIMLVFIAPFEVYKRDTQAIRDEWGKDVEVKRGDFKRVIDGYENDILKANKKIEALQQEMQRLKRTQGGKNATS